ncbi:NADH-quinone oxidoreductase subunit F [Crassaminicella thermophila]|uniref:NADH-quinone oxidoreductase subunit F n=1 Tax=Crassaminicella thermophila TaxID=2599308 RepID=A0A5C0SGR7_CRATE|nr:NADH-ubiquinone oxidoreductase-F iron-sulfur binding region domain-containing protein [Crassaminicella thermophila]QEK12847.1 NADH-quinone oxidoreductase subunit F [Crassaminicella thermophila]
MKKTVSLISKNFKKIHPESLKEYLKAGGYDGLKNALPLTSLEVITAVKKSGIKGRGGAAYPTGLKWEQAAAIPGPRKIVICNADEGEPGTFKDRYLLEYDPFKIIEGMTIAAYAVGANEGYIYIREEYKKLQNRMRKIIDIAIQNGFLGNNILGTNFKFNIKVFSGAGAYVCGENSTLIESMEGKSGRPRIKPPYIKERGLFNLPTLVNNVETFSIIPVIFTIGPEEYAKYGTPNSRGTKLISIAGNIKKPGTYEIPFGITLNEIVFDIGGGIRNNKKLKFLQIGGASGSIVPASMTHIRYCYEDFKEHNITMGSGAILVADETIKVVDFLKSVQDFFLHESCGKCTPCREGNRQLSKIFNRFVKGNASIEDFKTIERFGKVMKYCSFCGLGQSATTALLSAIKHFPDEFYTHIDKVHKTI